MRGRSRAGLGYLALRRGGRSVAGAVLASLLAGALAASALGDTAPVPAGSPWTDAAHDTPLEQLAGSIASHIAGTAVSVRCESDGDWATIVAAQGGDPNGESGFVANEWNGSTGELVSLSTVAELSSGVCVPLEQFASALASRPSASSSRPARSPRRDAARTERRSRGRRPPLPLALLPGRRQEGGGDDSLLLGELCRQYAVAILTLAHESIHLGGIVGGTLSNGLAVGDQQAEAKADCFGMQWMPYVAEQLGDTPDDAQAVARYFWEEVYPLSLPLHPQYWSADCRPGGALDTRPPGTTAWP